MRKLGVLDYYNLKNIQADTKMKNELQISMSMSWLLNLVIKKRDRNLLSAMLQLHCQRDNKRTVFASWSN